MSDALKNETLDNLAGGIGVNYDMVLKRRKVREENKKRREEGLDALKADGNDAFKQGDYKKAALLYGAAMEKYGHKATICANLAAALCKLQLWKEADWAATQALKANPKMTKARFRRAMARKALKRWDASLRDLQVIVKTDPDFKEALPELTWVRARSEKAFENDETDHDDGQYVNPINPHWPFHNMEPMEYDEESDTEDSKHKGNGTACRFYNHAGCFRGKECTFSHAPDDKSVRDEMGKNVCIHFLVGDCKYGVNCIYSHDKRYLPAGGWWNDAQATKMVEFALEQFSYEGFTAERSETMYYHLPGISMTVMQQAYKELDNSRLKEVLEAVEKVKVKATPKPKAKATAGPPTASTSTAAGASTSKSAAATPAPTTTTPSTGVIPVQGAFILLISLDSSSGWISERTTKPLLASIARTGLGAVQSLQPTETLAKLTSPLLRGVLVTDAAIAKRKHHPVRDALAAYARGGGTVVLGCDFANFVAGDEFAAVFEVFGLPWQRGSYHRTTHYLNKAANEVAKANPSLVPSYSMKALHADGVAPEEVVYGPTNKSVTQSLVFAPQRVTKRGEAPVVMGTVGKGRVGYVGDVNAEKPTGDVYLAMLGILDELGAPAAAPSVEGSGGGVPVDVKGKTPVFGPNAPKSAAPTSKTTAPKAQPKPAAAIPTVRATPVSTPPKAQQSTPAFSTPSQTSGTLLVAVLAESQGSTSTKYTETFATQLALLKSKTPVTIISAPAALAAMLTSDTASVRGIYLADAGILTPSNRALLEKVAEYAKAGGTVVAGARFASGVNYPGAKLFFGAFGLEWEMVTVGSGRAGKRAAWADGRGRAVYERVEGSVLGRVNPSLVDMFTLRAVSMRRNGEGDEDGDGDGAEVYVEVASDSGSESGSDDDDEDEDDDDDDEEEDGGSPILYERVGRGALGYIGSLEGPSDEVDKVVLAMFGLLHPELYAPTKPQAQTTVTNAPPTTGPQRKPKPFVLFLSWDTPATNDTPTTNKNNHLDDTYGAFLDPLKRKVEVVYKGLSIERMTDLVDSPDLLAVHVASPHVASPDEAYLRSRLVAFTERGGRVVFLDGFARGVTVFECEPFFRELWGVDWSLSSSSAAGMYPNIDVQENGKNVLFAKDVNMASSMGTLPEVRDLDFSEAHALTVADPAHVVYVPGAAVMARSGQGANRTVWDVEKKRFVGPVLYAAVGEDGKGRVGFVGKVRPFTDYYRIVSAMIGVV